MELFMNCENCAGTGLSKCSACLCNSCAGTGEIACIECKTGEIPCQSCFGVGQIVQNFLFIKRNTPCSSCKGKGWQQCSKCSGSKKIPCRTCGGTGSSPYATYGKTDSTLTCVICAGSRQVRCTACNGAGQVETEWSKKLKSSSLDWLEYEYNYRERRWEDIEENKKMYHDYLSEDHKLYMSTHEDYLLRQLAENNEKLDNCRRESEEVLKEQSYIRDIMKTKRGW